MAEVLFDNLEIRAFRAFDYLSIEKLGHVNLIIGKNNLGKSTLLEALWLRASLGSPDVIRAILEGRDEPSERQGGRVHEPLVNCLFHGRPQLESIAYSIQIGRIKAPDSALSISLTWLVDSKDDRGFIEAESRDGVDEADTIPALEVKCGAMRRVLRLDHGFAALSRRWKLQERSSREFAIPCVLVGSSGLTDDELKSLWEKVVLTDAEDDVVEAMRLISPDVDDFAVLPSETNRSSVRIRFRDAERPVSLKTMGDGMNRMFGIALALASAKGGILLVDEIENGIHWSVVPNLWRFILKVAKRLNVQVFATTHSNDCLKAFHVGTKGDADMHGVAIRLEKQNGEFSAELFDESRLAVIVKEGIEIR